MSTNVKDTTEVEVNVYFGRHAEVTVRYLTSKPTGLRVVSTKWLEDADERSGGHPAGTTVVSVIRGDGRKTNFEVFATEVKPPFTVGISRRQP